MPWRKTNDPYRIWVSEIMLQQTRVDTVIPYYQRFLDAFPTVHDLATADRQEVLKLWEGLGYYSRARNLQDAAQTVSRELNGQLPDSYKDILKLKGIGPYTAAAVLSIAFDKPYAVVDGNVLRVLTRFYGIEDDIRRQSTKNLVQKLADEIIDREHPGDFNQAIMELGATVCTPSRPECWNCPLAAECIANKTASTGQIPFKSPRKKTPHHHIGVGLIRNQSGHLLIALRPEEAMLGGLWEFPGGKKKPNENIKDTVKRELKEELGCMVTLEKELMVVKHAYSHFRITLHAWWCRLSPDSPDPSPRSSQQIRWVKPSDLSNYPFPKANKVLTEKVMKMR